MQALPWYQDTDGECAVFEAAHRARLPVLLKGPTGAGKSRLVEHMAARLERPLITVACHDDTSAVDLVGRFVLEGGETRWVDGPVTRAAREGAVLYLDELAEARSDVMVVIHPLADHRRQVFIERRNEVVEAAPGFMLVVSFNPGYQRGLKELKPSTRQRFVAIDFEYPKPELEQAILQREAGVGRDEARKLVALANRVRGLDELGLAEVPSTRLLVSAAKLMNVGVPARQACRVGVVRPLTDDPEVRGALDDLVAMVF
ncbi:MAG: CbbQ/NirQ/NorQ/GpvN family protein [Myxococcales bacterium]|nr:CbbQ/NirQ/NorQ/GpvN family protein [Myxococcales bacterium]MCB9648943.1 CbbQ/NirQ/NorQ/GpvN family protein [Deltaproteobacteria bacterium]